MYFYLSVYNIDIYAFIWMPKYDIMKYDRGLKTLGTVWTSGWSDTYLMVIARITRIIVENIFV